MIYLDHNATTPIRPQVADAMARASIELLGNPSSVHAAGRLARSAIERSRRQVARFLGALDEEIVFTSGGTEGDNLAIRGLAEVAAARGRRHLITSPIEHPAVLGAVEALRATGFQVSFLPVSSCGEIAVTDLEAALRDDTGLVTLAWANHELGNLYPIARLCVVARARGALLHTDAVQAAGKVNVDLAAGAVDAATISAHKIGGPKGVGAVFVRRGLDLPPLVSGGHQERERRPGTENVAGIIGFGVACERSAAVWADELPRMEALRARLHRGLLAIAGARIFAAAAASDRLPGTTMVSFAGAPGQLVAIGLDLEGICVSTGAACTSGSLEPSPVLKALGLSPEEAGEGLRLSLGWTSNPDDIDRLLEILPGIVERVRAAVVVGGRGLGDASAGEIALRGAS